MVRGSCLCGSVSYEIHDSPDGMYYGRCAMCRKASGSFLATDMLVREADFVVTAGQALIRAFQSIAGEWRYFCSECGSPIYAQAHARPGEISVRCGTLDNDPTVRPAEHIYTGSKAPWFAIDDGLSQFTEAQEQ